MTRGRSRSGYTIIGLLVSIIIIGFLYNSQLGRLFKPGTETEPATAKLPDDARKAMFKMLCDQIRTGLQAAESMGKPAPKTWAEVYKIGLDPGMKDPWEGKFYFKDGWIRCTGNPKAMERI